MIILHANSQQIYVNPGTFTDHQTSEILNPETGLWEDGPALPISFKLGCAIALNDEESKHLAVPGQTAETYTYDWLGSQVWEPAGDRSQIGNSFACTRALVEGGAREVVVVAGGKTFGLSMTTVDFYNIQSGSW